MTRLQLPKAPDASVPALAAAAAQLTTLRQLVVDDGGGLTAVVEACRDLPELSYLGAMRAHCRPGSRFFAAVAALTALTTLALDSRCNEYPAAPPLAAYLRALRSTLREVRVHDSFFCDDPAPMLAALPDLPRLRKLTLSGLRFDDDAPLSGLLPVFRRHSSLQQLQLDDFSLPERLEAALVPCWARCVELTALALSGWGCSPAFWPAFAAACTTLSALRVFRSQVGGIGEAEGRALARALRHMTALRYLDLGRNELGAAAVDIARAVAPHPGLTRLRLHGCEVPEVAVGEVLAEVPKMSALDSLDLTGNVVGLGGARLLAAALESMPRLRVVKLMEGQGGGDEGKAVLESVATGVQAPLPTHGTPPELTPPPAGELPRTKLVSWAIGVWEIVED